MTSSNNETDRPASLSELADELARLEARASTLSAREDELQAELDRAVAAYDLITDEIKAARLRTITAVLERSGAAVPGIVDWHYGVEPLGMVHEAGRTYLVAAGVSDDSIPDRPDRLEHLAGRCVLIVVDTAAIDGLSR